MSKPTVTLTLAGDESKLTQSFDKVGSAAKQMSSQVDDASSRIKETSGSAFDTMAEHTDSSEQKFQGFADTITGFSDVATGFKDGDVVTMLTGFADLAGGVTDFLLPVFGALVGFIRGPMIGAIRAFGVALFTTPLGWIVLAIMGVIAAFVLLWNKSEGFRNFWKRVWEGIKNVVGAVIDWIKSAWNGIVDWFRNLPQRIGSALGGIGGFFREAFRGAANMAIDAVNWMVDRINNLIYGINLVNPFSDIPSIPHVPRMHTGGVVPGMVGSERLMMLQAGERVTTRGQAAGGGATVAFTGDVDSAFASAFMKLVRSGDIQVVAS